MKIGIVGAGSVGRACLLSVVMRGSARELVLVNRDRKRAKAVVTDVQYGEILSPPIAICDGDYPDLSGASVVMITAGENEKSGGATDRSDPLGRLRLLRANTAIYQDIVPKIHNVAPDAVILVVTDPPDPLADVVRVLGHERVLSTGTYLDSLRFRFHIARRLTVSARDVDALVLGEHGTSEVFLWSSARVGGRKVLDLFSEDTSNPEKLCEKLENEVRYANITIIEGTGASQYGIGMVSARITEMILRDERAVIPRGVFPAVAIEDLALRQWRNGPMTLHWKQTRAEWAVAILLAMIAGYLDGYGLLFLGTYVSFMSGNTTSTGLRSGQSDFHAAFPPAVAIVFFVTGSFLGNLLSQSRLSHSNRIMFCLIASEFATVAGLEWSGLRNVYFEIALLSLAMGMTNPALSKIGAESVSLTFVTGTLSRIGGHLASAAGRKPLKERPGPGDSHLARALVEASVWCGFLAGAVLSGIAGSKFRTWALLPPCVVMLALGLFSKCATPTREKKV